MIGNQYANYYTGVMMAFLIRTGYVKDPRIEKVFKSRLQMRHKDGGWTVPMQTPQLSRETRNKITSEYGEPLKPKKDKLFSRLATELVLRAFAADPRCRYLENAHQAGNLLKS